MALVLGACVSKPPVAVAPPVVDPPLAPVVIMPPPKPAPLVIAPEPEPAPALVSKARSDREFRKDAARHIYEQDAHRIYTGRLPPLLKAVGVMDVVVDRRGNVLRVEWRRAPKHAPDVIKEIERTVMAAAPYPAPIHLGQATYTETWLWDKSGRFQLDTLTEGQR
jgi:protein TonB